MDGKGDGIHIHVWGGTHTMHVSLSFREIGERGEGSEREPTGETHTSHSSHTHTPPTRYFRRQLFSRVIGAHSAKLHSSMYMGRGMEGVFFFPEMPAFFSLMHHCGGRVCKGHSSFCLSGTEPEEQRRRRQEMTFLISQPLLSLPPLHYFHASSSFSSNFLSFSPSLIEVRHILSPMPVTA